MKIAIVFFTRIAIVLTGLVLVNTTTAAPVGWPTSISADNGFADLGGAIKNEPSFPKNGTEIEKARYIFSRMQDVAKTYGLKSGTSSPLSSLVIGISRFKNDPEGADCLKTSVGWGNCGEWSYALSEVFGGAGVNNRPAYGDASGGTGRSLTFNGTDTMVFVEERAPDGKLSRRVFDVFRAAYHSGIDQPTVESLQEWGDLPLTDYDKWKDETRRSWQSMVGKPFIKDASSQSELDLSFPASLDPRAVNRPGSTSTQTTTGGGSASLTVSNDKPVKVATSFATRKGATYIIEASGVISDWSDKSDGVDAVWCYAEWRCGKGEPWQQLRIDDRGLMEITGQTIPYNASHTYRIEAPGTGAPFVFHMSDAQGSSSDNSGAIQVTVTEKR